MCSDATLRPDRVQSGCGPSCRSSRQLANVSRPPTDTTEKGQGRSVTAVAASAEGAEGAVVAGCLQ